MSTATDTLEHDAHHDDHHHGPAKGIKAGCSQPITKISERYIFGSHLLCF